MEAVTLAISTLWAMQRSASVFLTGRSVLDDYLTQATRSLVASILTPLVALCIAVAAAWITTRWLPTLWDRLLKVLAYVLVTLVAIAVGFVVFTLVVKYTEPPVTWFVDYILARVMPAAAIVEPLPPPPPPTVPLKFCSPWAWWPCTA